MKKIAWFNRRQILLMGLQTERRVRSTTKALYHCWAPVYFFKPRLFVHLFWAVPDTNVLVV
jgi:hypothetical protein